MKYYVRKKRGNYNIDYTKDSFQLCWTCQKACGGCNWSRSFKPVPGWIAEKTFIPSNDAHAESYKIISCPEYIQDKR